MRSFMLHDNNNLGFTPCCNHDLTFIVIHNNSPNGVVVYLMVILTWMTVVILELRHAPKPDFLEGLCLSKMKRVSLNVETRSGLYSGFLRLREIAIYSGFLAIYNPDFYVYDF